MKKYIKLLLLCLCVIVVLPLFGCSNKDDNMKNKDILVENERLLFEDTVSPNKEYVDSVSDVVNYTVKIYQNNVKKIIVSAESNSVFFKGTEYEIHYDKEISKANISVKWTTINGNSDATENDQIAIAEVSIFDKDKIISQRNINFFKGGVEIIIDTINKK